MNDLEFTVMPRGDGGENLSPADQQESEPEHQGPQEPQPPRSSGGFLEWILNHVKALMVGLLILGVLGVGGFYGYQYLNREPSTENEVSDQPDINVPEVSQDANVDTDKDGLTDEQEKLSATNPKKSDTDGDGLADGDEINVYLSDPLLVDTDSDGYEDGREAAGGYSPTSNASQKAGPEEIQKWTNAISQFGLHQPTQSTLKLAASSPTEQSVTYVNTVFGYSISLPSVLTYREDQEKRVVGIYVSGTLPDDPDLTTDPISLGVAVKVPNQTLKDWINLQYPISEYVTVEELTINSLEAVRLKGVKGESCAQDKTFIPRGSTILVLTWACTEHKAFGPYYEQIVQSFKFQ